MSQDWGIVDSVCITIYASGVMSATLVDRDDMIIEEQPVAPGALLVAFIRELWTLGFENGAVSVHPVRGETHIYFVRPEA